MNAFTDLMTAALDGARNRGITGLRVETTDKDTARFTYPEPTADRGVTAVELSLCDKGFTAAETFAVDDGVGALHPMYADSQYTEQSTPTSLMVFDYDEGLVSGFLEGTHTPATPRSPGFDPVALPGDKFPSQPYSASEARVLALLAKNASLSIYEHTYDGSVEFWSFTIAGDEYCIEPTRPNSSHPSFRLDIGDPGFGQGDSVTATFAGDNALDELLERLGQAIQ